MECTARIESVAHGGHGVCRIEGQVCFVPYGLPGDTVRLRVLRQSKGVLWAAIVDVIDPSPDRQEACCPCSGACGGCVWLQFRYPAQADWKRRIVRDCLARIGGVDADVGWIEDAALRLGYRTRATFHAAQGWFGFYAEASHTVVDVERCPLCHGHLNAALERLRGVVRDGSIEVVANPEGPEVLVWTARPVPALRGIVACLNSPQDPEPHQFLFDGRPIVNGAFSQSSLLLNRLLVRHVEQRIGAASRVLDLYCGNGNLSMGLPPSVDVQGFDQDRAAIRAANRLRSGAYGVGGEVPFRHALRDPYDVVLLDPPRTGAKAIAADLAASRTDRIVYISCDPATMARDLKVLIAHDWRLVETVAIDLFPNTAHVETVCVLERK